jgi:hypothetical protein
MKNNQIKTFIQSITKQDYSTANKHLKSIIENKLLSRINNCKSKNIFNKKP